ncbi:MAG TPA: hypothetical protein ENJ99_05055 [Rhizobiales bacterium]|nr:hypothetical protein [Hyphomicrobiales bacterium]
MKTLKKLTCAIAAGVLMLIPQITGAKAGERPDTQTVAGAYGGRYVGGRHHRGGRHLRGGRGRFHGRHFYRRHHRRWRHRRRHFYGSLFYGIPFGGYGYYGGYPYYGYPYYGYPYGYGYGYGYGGPTIVLGGSSYRRRARISCSAARRIVRSHGYRHVRATDCRGSRYTFLATKRGHRYRIRMYSRSGRIYKVRRY